MKLKLTNVDITSFIRELLFGHECVIVPGFGGFIGNYVAARMDKSSGMFYPPVKQITFNRNLNHNDGLLVKEISARLEVNYGDARDIVNEYVNGLKKKLEKGERIVLNGIGTFVLNHEGNIEFEPDRSINFHLDSYGLESFRYQQAEAYDVRKRITGSQTDVPVRHISMRKYLWRAAVLVPVAGVLFALSLRTDFFKAKVETTSMNPLVSAEFEDNRAAVEKENSAVPVIITDSVSSENPVAEAVIPEASAPAPAEEAAITVTEAGAYYIITGSFQSEANAGKQVSQLQAEGFNPEVVQTENGFYRVCAMACPDLRTAVNKKDSILKKFPGAWVSRKK